MNLSKNFTRWTLGRMQNPVRGFLHGGAAITSVVGTTFLVIRAPHWPARTAAIVFGIGLLGLFTASSLYHSIPWRDVWKLRMQRLDHSMIFVLIAASYTPIAVMILEGTWRWIALIVAWGIALVGILNRVFAPMDRHVFSFSLMLILGWLSVPIMFPLAQRAGAAAVVLMAIGGGLYTVGMIFKVTRWPKLWPRVFSAHELFHVFVVAASVFHWTATYRYVLTAA
ncbi:MAG: hemolysin III family protein [bacterium]|nr:hemolysin III family protein [bacterium]MCP4964063.1 hemolysin III family protein [bacterium]